jgi:hypothetical protein
MQEKYILLTTDCVCITCKLFRMKGSSRSRSGSSPTESPLADPGCANRCCATLVLTPTLLAEFHLLRDPREISSNAFMGLVRLFQAECEELGQRAEALRSENSSLRAELERIRKEYEQLLSQNASLKV